MNQLYKGRLDWQRRYADAHYKHSCEKYPSIVSDGMYCLPLFPSVITSNGLTQAIVNYCGWMGQYANRVNTMGRVIKGKDTQTAMGTIKGKEVMIKGSTKKGTADLNCIINSFSVQIEIKVGKDRQSEAQKEQEKIVTRAGGYYFIVRTIEEFFVIYDKFMSIPIVKPLF